MVSTKANQQKNSTLYIPYHHFLLIEKWIGSDEVGELTPSFNKGFDEYISKE